MLDTAVHMLSVLLLMQFDEIVDLPFMAISLLQGEARQAMATADLMLGEWLPDVHLSFQVEVL